MPNKESHTEFHDECSHLTCTNDADISKIFKVSILIFIFMCLEIYGHYKTNSLSLLADSLHLLVDILGFIISMFALHWAKRRSDNNMTFGYHRYEIIGSLFSVGFIWIAVGYLIGEAIHKYIHPKEIDGGMFFAIAVIGFFVNLLAIYFLHHEDLSHKLKHKNLNMRAAYVHIIGDLIQSVGVIIAGCITYFYPSKAIFDILCTVSFSFLVLLSSIPLIRDAIHILSEGTPKDVKLEEVKNDILDIESIYKIVEVYSWSLSPNRKAIMVKILAEDLLINDYENLLMRINKILKEKHRFDILNVQIDTPGTYHGNSGLVVDGTTLNINNPFDSKTPF